MIFLTLWPFRNQRNTQEGISSINDRDSEREGGGVRERQTESEREKVQEKIYCAHRTR